MTIRSYSAVFLPLAGALALTSAARASYVETFTAGSNVGGWSWNFDDTNPSTGGNPGAYLANGALDTWGPILSSAIGTSSPFVGNLRAAGVTGMSFDFRVDHTDFNTGGEAFSLTLVLRNTHGTESVDDDDYAYSVGGEMPAVGEGWAHYAYAIDSATNDLPTGWLGGYGGDEPGAFQPGVTWGDVITNVDQVEFRVVQPGYFAIFQNWSIGADNVAVTTAPVPEPATLAVLGMGALLAFRRKRSS